MMIDAVMYGMIPRKKIDTLVIAPPAKRSRNPITPPFFAWSCRSLIASKLTNGTGRCAPNRYTAMIATVKKILLRRSGTRNMFRSRDNTAEPPAASSKRDRQLTGWRVRSPWPAGDGRPTAQG